MIDWVKKFTGELIDIIEWLDDSSNTLVYRYERNNNEIKYGAKLTVREGQMAVFINEGRWQMYTSPACTRSPRKICRFFPR